MPPIRRRNASDCRRWPPSLRPSPSTSRDWLPDSATRKPPRRRPPVTRPSSFGLRPRSPPRGRSRPSQYLVWGATPGAPCGTPPGRSPRLRRTTIATSRSPELPPGACSASRSWPPSPLVDLSVSKRSCRTPPPKRPQPRSRLWSAPSTRFGCLSQRLRTSPRTSSRWRPPTRVSPRQCPTGSSRPPPAGRRCSPP